MGSVYGLGEDLKTVPSININKRKKKKKKNKQNDRRIDFFEEMAKALNGRGKRLVQKK